MKVPYLMLLLSTYALSNSEFVIAKKDREEKKIAKLSFAKLKEELAYRADPAIKQALHLIELLARVQKQLVPVGLDATTIHAIADMQSILAQLVLLFVSGVGDLAMQSQQTSFGKAGKKELVVYCDRCHEVEALLEAINKQLTALLTLVKAEEIKKEWRTLNLQLPTWQQTIKATIAALST